VYQIRTSCELEMYYFHIDPLGWVLVPSSEE